jgi:hypothetical protein
LGSGAEGRGAIVILGATDMSAPATYSIDASKANLFPQNTDIPRDRPEMIQHQPNMEEKKRRTLWKNPVFCLG